ncbi:MAG: hypothetical protein LBQ42_02170 [Synergistaceae bacterium]|jgi:hypothetical protein|nr:hypothetical protein [Synergistaceae bacterium]
MGSGKKRAFALRVLCRLAWAILCCVALSAALPVEMAFADIQQDVGRIFELNAKIRPGMTIDAVNELLGPPAEKYVMSAKASAVTRYMWLHGEMGVEIYEMDDVAYRVNITLPCGSAKETSRAMDALTRQGNSKYGSMPRFDSRTAQYYWIGNGVRFAFSKYDQTTVLSSCTKMQ